ncbi:MAG TPA: HNH endonuclease [Chitinophagaceae bacterium]|nr:HNH endonuclease [Chitinophagaceae bacterium]
MNFYLGATDTSWFNYLKNISAEDVNFWQPSGIWNYKGLSQGEPFLFKLKRPYNVIGGIGFFLSFTHLPINVAWDVFEQRNGCATFQEFKQLINKYRKGKESDNPIIGCIVLSNAIFFREEDWINVDKYYSRTGIVQGKPYSLQSDQGNHLWKEIDMVLKKYLYATRPGEENQFTLNDTEWPGYGKSIFQKVRIGQPGFRILVTDAYNRKCTISGEKTLPVLEAAHIKKYSLQGPHTISNGVLLRSDLHKLFDSGYITITSDYKVQVSRKIKEEFENGREYYRYHGQELLHLPLKEINKPSKEFIEWHNTLFKG